MLSQFLNTFLFFTFALLTSSLSLASDSLSIVHQRDSLHLVLRQSIGQTERAEALLTLADTYRELDQLDSAIYYTSQCRQLLITLDEPARLAEVHLSLEDLHKSKAEYTESMQNNFAALAIYEELGDKKGVGLCYTRLCDLLYYEDHYQEGIDYCNKAIALQSEIADHTDLALSYRYRADNELQLALYDEALNSITIAIDTLQAIGTSALDLRGYRNTKGNIYKFMERYDEALAIYRSIYELTKNTGQPERELIAPIANIGHVFTLQGKEEFAIPCTIEAIDIMKRSGNLQNLWENYMHLSNQYEAVGQLDSALKYNRLFADRHIAYQYNTIANLKKELQVKYETAKKVETISTQEEVISQQSRMQALYLGIAALLALMAFGLLYFNRKRKLRNAELQSLNLALDEKNIQNELLLREIHHRVKNNLAIVQSLISLQSAKMEDSAGRDAMIESKSRVESMSIIHQRLYQGAELGTIEMREYFKTLGEGILDAYGAHEQIRIDCNMDALDLDVDTAIPIGLIVNEILTNAMKYAFPDGRKGQVDILLEPADDGYLKLEVKDDGIGKDSEVKRDGFGSQLIQLLCKQLKGTMQEQQQGGTLVSMRLKMRKAA